MSSSISRGISEIFIDENEEDQVLLSNTTTTLGSTNSTYELDNSAATSRYISWSAKRRHFVNNFWRRIPKSKAVAYILLINALQSIAYSIVIQKTITDVLGASQHTDLTTLVVLAVQAGIPALFYPIGGIIGDVYLGRHFISVVCLFISWISYCVLSFSLSIADNISEEVVKFTFEKVISLLTLIVIVASDGIFQVNWLTFGADQLINAPSEETSSYIYWWYWTKNLGIVIGILVDTSLAALLGLSIYYPVIKSVIPCLVPFISAVIITVVILLHKKIRYMFDHERVNKNPLSQICGVFYNALTSRPKQPFLSAFRYGEDPPSGLEYARQYHDGKYTDEQVGDVRSFVRIILVIIMISGYSATYVGVWNMVTLQLQECIQNPTGEDDARNSVVIFIQQSLYVLYDSTLILFLLPVWSNLIFPLLGHYHPNTRKRMGVGLAIGLLGSLIAALLELNPSSIESIRVSLLFIPSAVVVIGESLVFVPVLEFIYAQSPDNMKGLLIGFHYLLYGMYTTIAGVIIFKINPQLECSSVNPSAIKSDTVFWYYMGYALISIVGLLLFSIVSYKYKNRSRNNPISDIMRVSMYYN